MYRIVYNSIKLRWYWKGKGYWTTHSPDAKLYASEGIAHRSLMQMWQQKENKMCAYTERVPPILISRQPK